MRDFELTLLEHWKTSQEIFDEAVRIGDVRTPEGKRRMIAFLAKASLLDGETTYSFKTQLPNGLKGEFQGYFSGKVQRTVADAFNAFIETCTPPTKEYYFDEKGGLKNVPDPALDNVIGNAIIDLRTCLHYGYGQIHRINDVRYNCDVKPYSTEEDVLSLEGTCEEYILSKEDKGPTL